MSSGLVYLRPKFVMFYRAIGSYDTSATMAWDRIFDWLDETGQRRNVCAGYGLLHDDPRVVEKERCRYDACIEIPEGMETKIIGRFSIQKLPGGAFSRQRHRGSVSEISQTISKMRDELVPQSGLGVDTHRPVLEIYHDDPQLVADGARKIDVCIPVSAKTSGETSRTAA